MTAVTEYLHGLAGRLTADGCWVRTERWGAQDVLLGHRSDFRWEWFATNLHLFTVATAAEEVTQQDIAAFTDHAWDHMLARKGQLRGLQTAVAVLPCLVGTRVAPDAAAWAAAQQRLRFATFARPVVVDTTARSIAAFTGRVTVGGSYNTHLIDKLRSYFPGVA